MADPTLTASSARGASFLILLQLLSRALTFAVNNLLLRYLTPALLGAAARLDLLAATALFFARESLRVALQRAPPGRAGAQAVVNMAYIAVGVGAPLSAGLAAAYLWGSGDDAGPDGDATQGASSAATVPYLREAVVVFTLATVVELLAEPAFAVAQHLLLYRVRAAAEAAATVAKCLGACGLAVWGGRRGREVGVLPFAAGQAAYASVLLGVYAVQVHPTASEGKFSLLPRRLPPSRPPQGRSQDIMQLFPRPLVGLSIYLTVQSSLKYLLTQGDALLITSLATVSDQGAYALASNYGGLIARMLFQPIEESSRNLFAKLCAPTSPRDTPGEEQRSSREAGDPATVRRDKASLRQSSHILTTILRLYLLISLPLLTLGPSISRPLLAIVAGPRWVNTQAADVLAAYACYLPFLALNGVTEAFVAAVADATALRAQSVAMAAFFVAFAGASYGFVTVLGEGGRGLVWANCLNMGLRIWWNVGFIRRFFVRETSETFDLLAILPSATSVATTATIPALLRATEGYLVRLGSVGELARVGSIAAVFCTVLLVSEREFVLQCYRMARPSTPRREEKARREG